MTDFLDDTLAEWTKRLTTVSSNILELAEMDTYRRLIGADGFAIVKLAGESYSALHPTLAKVPELWCYLSVLTDHIDRARTLRGTQARWLLSEKVVQEIMNLLESDSIDLNQALPEQQLIGDAALLSATQLYNSLLNLFEQVKEVVLSVDSLWLALPELISGKEHELEQLNQLGKSLAESIDTDTLLEKLTNLREKIYTDPVGVSLSLHSDVDKAIALLRDRLEDVQQKYGQLRGNFRRAHQTIDQLKEIRCRAQAAYLQAPEKVANPQGLIKPTELEKIEDLEDWLKILERTLSDGHRKPVLVGLQKWSKSAEHLLSQERATLIANEAPLQHREELRGLLAALQAKADANSSCAANEDPHMQELLQTAKKLLHSNQTPLDQARCVVAKYETMLSDYLKAHSLGELTQ